jgi:hypothetical protein
VTRSITTWNRLEPRSTAADAGPGAGLEARVYDAAWLLGRQWQLGELSGEDAASPGFVRLQVATSRVTRYRPGADSGVGVPLGPDDLLEPIAETEAEEANDWRVSAEAGAHFLSLLAGAGLQQLRGAFVAAYPLPDPAQLGDGPDPAEVRVLRLLRRRSLDGAGLREAVRAAAPAANGAIALPEQPSVPPALATRVKEVLRRWLAWYPAPRTGPSWQADRMEYRFAVAGPSPAGTGEVVFEANEYEGGRLDWPDLRVVKGRTLGAGEDGASTRIAHTAIPTPVMYPGMPASRWWEFEDARVWFGGIETEAGDLARMLLVEFATVYGNDWFIVPLELTVGTLAQIEALVVMDTFGQATLVRPTEVARSGAGPLPWRMFRTTGAPPGLVLVPPVVAHSLEGTSVEDVVFLRDETANMAWAIERRVTGPAGNVIDRYERWRARVGDAPRAAAADGELLTYRLATEVPDHWIPLVPRSVGLRSIRFDRGNVVSADGTTFPPRGRLLEPERPLSLFEEELPRSGLAVTRAWQLARGADGSTVAWIGRRKKVGRGEGSSGLAFDQLFLPPPGRE